MPSIELIKALRHAVLAEMEKRARQRGLDLGKDMRTILYEKLDAMQARRQALGEQPRPLTTAEKADLMEYLRRRASSAKQ